MIWDKRELTSNCRSEVAAASLKYHINLIGKFLNWLFTAGDH